MVWLQYDIARHQSDGSYPTLDLSADRGGIPDFMFDFGYIISPLYTRSPSFRPADFSRSPIVYRPIFTSYPQNGISFPLTIALISSQTASKVALVPFRHKLMPYCLTMP